MDLILQATDPIDHTWKYLVMDLLEHDMQISGRCRPIGHFESYGSWVEFPFNGFANPFSGCSEATKLVVLRDCEAFRALVKTDQIGHRLRTDDAVRLFRLSSRMGWVEGCEIMFEAGLRFVPDEGRKEYCRDHCHYSHQYDEDPRHNHIVATFLCDAVESRNLLMIDCWIAIREESEANAMPYIGSLEEAFIVASQKLADRAVAEHMLTRLIQQRRRIRQLAEEHDITYCYTAARQGLLDAHAECVLRTLVDLGVYVPPSLWPHCRSVYYAMAFCGGYGKYGISHLSTESTTLTLERLHNAGFVEISAKNYSCVYGTFNPPLVYTATTYDLVVYYIEPLLEATIWFLSKEASLVDLEPDTKTAAITLLGYRVYTHIFVNEEGLASQSIHALATMFECEYRDACNCSCSTNGCLGLTSF